jgi:hypothetical protein
MFFFSALKTLFLPPLPFIAAKVVYIEGAYLI